MSAARIAFGIVLLATACSDGGPPGSLDDDADWTRTGSHHAPETAADGGGHHTSDQRADADSPLDVSDTEPRQQDGHALSALCDGSPGITFSALMIGGGQPDVGLQVMGENGYSFLIIEGNCQYWALDGLFSHVTTGKLSEADQQGVVDALHLDEWPLNTGAAGSTFADSPTYYMLFGRELNALDCTSERAADGCEKVGGATHDWSALLSSYESKLGELSERGEPLDGDVRYVLVEDGKSLALDWDKPGTWPLGDPTHVAMSQQAAASYKPGQSQIARGDDAQALQEVWSKFLDGEISGHQPGGHLGIPVEVEGKQYALFLRDSIPLENERGLILF